MNNNVNNMMTNNANAHNIDMRQPFNAYTHKKYDKSYIETNRQNEAKMYGYTFDETKGISNNACWGGLTHGNIEHKKNIDIDSNMRHLNDTVPLNAKNIKNMSQYNMPLCDNRYKTEYTHLSPVIREKYIYRTDITIEDPQKEHRWLCERIGLNTSLDAKDNYIPKIPKLLSQTDGLPDGNKYLPCRKPSNLCYTYTDA
jgi:hypothetical protein